MNSDADAGSPGRAGDLSPARRALLAKWARTGASRESGITVGSQGAPVVLSFVQERQLFLELLDPYTAVNNLATCIRIEGPLDLAALERSANQTVARHEALRTSFNLNQGRAVPQIAPALSLDVVVVSLETHHDREVEALRLAEREAHRPFDLGRPPLLRAKAFRLGAELHVLVIVIHHTIADGWSLGVLLRELFLHYRGESRGVASELPPLPIQYRDFAAWQRDPRHTSLFERQLGYWKEQLGGVLPVLDLPIDRPRGIRQTFRGATHRFRVAGPVLAGLKELARRNDGTLFMALMAGYQALLHRYCRQDDLLVGTPTAGRTRPETQELIGAFINTLVLRTDLSGDPAFVELLRRVRETALASYAHQDLPFERLVAELRPQRVLSRTPVFQVMFIFQNSPLPEVELPGISLRLLTVDRGAAQFDLTLLVSESGGGLDAEFEYNSDLFDRATIERLAGSFQLLLDRVVADPDTRLSALPLMGEAERARLVVELNDTAADYPRALCVHQLFEAQVERTPDAVALLCEGSRLSYRELDRWANQLAAGLRDRGVGLGTPVGVHLERSPALVAALLAVLKAGSAYVPIDSTLPSERVRYILQDAGAAVVLTEGPLDRGGPVESFLVPPLAREAPLAVAAGRPVTPADLAYLIYTSGSTGRPKGVRIPHRALVNLLWSMRQMLDLGPGDALLAVTSVSFDIAALELYLPLITGGTVVLATRAEILDRRRLHAAIAANRVKALQATPSMWRLILQGDWPGDPGLLALSGGEPLTPELAEELLRRVGSLWNLYGPTETTVWSAARRIRPGERPITIGRPIANTQLYILDPHLQPLPVGPTGELVIGGDGVADGYHDLPQLSAERFIPVPSGLPARPGARLFRTGDLARHRPDGTIELLGRLDDQVKLNGFRVEPGEIEAALCRHPSIREAVVVPRQGSGGDKHLVAYMVPDPGTEPSASELREFLRATLPAYLIPAVFVLLESLPLTTAGKVNRRALPAPPVATTDPAFAAPNGPLEERLATTYAEVLGVPRVGIHDNFFDLGGGSIQILEIIVRAHAVGLSLSPQSFFEHQTVAELAASLSHGVPPAVSEAIDNG
ncbi:MAG: amino acid adenylation domain-containing protein [Gemmatimonadales bacterium]|nr:MAG: amino acid adenylation domain-containing protein [Gemmatimonadales bacterium]